MPHLPHSWLWIFAACWYVGLGVVAFVVFAWDKRAATRGAWRVRERTLLWLVWLGGFVGGWLAMRVVRHKTRKWWFRVSPWGALVLHGVGWVAVWRLGA